MILGEATEVESELLMQRRHNLNQGDGITARASFEYGLSTLLASTAVVT
jgi:hypothetical protein